MSTGNNHLLQKVIFEINLTKQDGAFEIQNRISNAFRSGILPQLEELFDSKIDSSTVVTIDNLEIDIGNIFSSELEANFELAVIREVETFLVLLNEQISQSAQAGKSGRLGTRTINIQWSVPGKPDFETEVKVSDKITSQFERVIRYLQSGIYSGGSEQGSSGKISVLINSLLEHHAEEFVQFLRANRNKNQVFHRLVLNLTSAQLMYVASLLGCRFSGNLSDRVNELVELMRVCDVDVRSVLSSRSLYFNNTEQYIWWLILTRYSGSDVIDSAFPEPVDAETNLLAEVILITRQLSERSDFPRKGRSVSKRDYKLTASLGKALELIQKLIADDFDSDDGTDTTVLNPLAPKAPNFSDSVALLKNSLFTLPEKLQGVSNHSAIEELPESDTGIYIDNAGLIILAPFLKPFFSRLDLLEGRSFKSVGAQWRAAHLLQYACGFAAADDESGTDENSLILNKLLCGLEIHQAMPEDVELTDNEKSEAQELLKSVLHHWTILSSSSVFALQSTFLQKKGRLSISGKDWDLLIERDSTVEILIDKLPWSISLVKLPWNSYTIQTQW